MREPTRDRHEQAPSPGRNDALDGLRALAALSVLAFHVWLYREDRPQRVADRDLLDRVLFEANIGLILFFVLSGFLLYRPFARAAVTETARPRLATYARRRAARILPAYYACALGCVALYTAFGPTTILPSARELPAFAVFAQNYSLDTLMQLNPVLWTLAIEIAFYVALPLLALVGLRLGRRHVGLHAAFLVALVGLTVGWYWLDFARDWGEIPRKTLPAYIGHFALGMLVALWLEHRRARGGSTLPPRVTVLVALAGGGAVLAQGYWHETAPHGTLARALFATLSAGAGFALVIAAAAQGTGPAVRWLRARVLVRVGVISYGLYLWHLPFLLVLRENDLLPQSLGPRTAVVLAISLAVAEASWRLLERPAIARSLRPRGGSVPFTPSKPALAQRT